MKTEINWKRSALILVDTQHDLLSPDGGAWDLFGGQVEKRGTVQNLRRLRDAAEACGLPILYSHIQITEEQYDALEPINGLQQLMGQRRLLQTGPGSQFLPELAPTADSVVLDARMEPSARKSNVFEELSKREIDTVVVAGMIANLCVDSQVRDASSEGLRTIVAQDAIATLSDELHDATVANFGLLATEVADTKDIVGAMES